MSYLSVRPSSEHRVLFLCVLAPFGPITSSVVANVVRRACRRAAVPQVGPDRLRHTAATEMLRARVSLEEIAQVLRHRQFVSTAHYARVDRDSLVRWRCRGRETGHDLVCVRRSMTISRLWRFPGVVSGPASG